MKKLCKLLFASALVFGTLLPVQAQETPTVTQSNQASLLEGSLTSLSASTDTFYALSLLANGADEATFAKIEAQVLPEVITFATSEKAGAQDVEKLIILVEGLGYDATAYVLNGKTVNLFDLLAEQDFAVTNDYAFALEALHSANYTSDNAALSKETLITKMLDMRNPSDHAWNYSGSGFDGPYGATDADSTAMALTALAPYATQAASVTGISETTKAAVDAAAVDGFAYLSGKQLATGDMDNYGGNACSTSMVILAMSAYGKDINTDPQFVKDGNTLVTGLLLYANEEGTGFFSSYTPGYDAFTTEQAVRSLITINKAVAGTPYYLYQAGAVANQDRFVVKTPEEVAPKKEETKKDDIVKDTASAAMPYSVVLAGMCIAGAVIVRKSKEA